MRRSIRPKQLRILGEAETRAARTITVADPDGFALTFTFGPLKRDMTMDALVNKIVTS